MVEKFQWSQCFKIFLGDVNMIWWDALEKFLLKYEHLITFSVEKMSTPWGSYCFVIAVVLNSITFGFLSDNRLSKSQNLAKNRFNFLFESYEIRYFNLPYAKRTFQFESFS